MKNIEDTIIKLAAQFTRGKEVITLDSTFKSDLKFDSLSLTEFVVACEDEFGIEIDLDHPDTANAKVLRDLYNAVLVLVDSK